MTDDGREGFAPGAEQDDAGDPAAAFEALRRTIEKQGGQIGAEMTIIRRGVGLMAGSPIGTGRPGRVTRPMPSPA